ncbi:tetratricopeptide repeat protein [Emticicia sp. BO119]|uniref:tetratricopeptide repeat protein n=1 Tax=Emticicia sp. BO119 TaxID=2757768 RepID=UPI0015F033E0|nr:tetratricopeptide repeat protein [Emticicia sp. BO119]MBA4849400.1 ATP-binding protein [Emticicia sp. BO119]
MPVEIKRDDYAIQAYIKNIFLELPTYKFHHSPLNGDGDEIFVGRKKIKDKFLNILKNGEKNGAYLITGYRGMGKTSFVKSVLSEYTEAEKNSNGQVLKVDISFAQVDLKETDILRQITKGLIDQVSSSWFVRFANTLSLPKVFRFLSFIISISFGFLLFHSHSGKKIKSLFHLESNGSKNMTGYDLFWLLIGMIVLIGFVTIVLTYLFDLLRLIILRLLKYKYRAICNEYKNQLNKNSLDKRYKSNHKNKVEKDNNSSERKFWGWYEKAILEVNLYKKLIHVYERANASIVKESGLQSSTTNIPFGFINKDVRTFPIANAKEIEYELIRILREYNDFINYNKKFVIVFDELDKVEPAIGKSYYFDDNKSLEQFELSQSQLIDLRERKKVIINILASLKHFITEANARFIFIAGREMFDASLADIADRQSSISSIFHQIIYVDSFLKDKPETNTKSSGLTDLVEMYLEKVLIPDDVFTKTYELKKIEYEEAKKANPNLKHENEDLFNDEDINKTDQESFFVKYNRYLRMLGKKPEERLKIIFTLQHFIIYLTYRSNGSPKKMVKLLEDYIIKDKDKESKMIDDPLYVVVKNNSLNTAREESLYLRFSVKSQYKFGFITYLYRPFLLSYSQFLKKYSDNVLVATPYLMDHLIKFHPFAFSVQNLELLPEVLSANKNPILRFFIEELINFLSQNHLRETEIGLFEYKFFNKSANEITYLSKIFEEESAAFNFTLDETYFIKIFLRNKIKDIRNSYRDFKDLSGTKYIFSISFLNGLLGDCHYFDQEFDDAIVSYQDALQVLRAMPIEELKQEEFVLMIRLKLKLGLIFEKMKSFESALSVYNDSIKLTESYFEINLEIIKKRTNGQISIFEDEQSKKTLSKFNSLNELLQIVNQAYTASLYMQEKVGIEGLTIYKLKAYINAFEALVEKVSKHTMENTIVRANFYSNIGALLYYKNFSIGSKVQNNDDEKTNSLLSDLIKEKFVEYRLGPQVEIYDEPNFQQYPEAKYNKDFRFPFYAFLSYRKALKILIPFGEDNEQEPLISILNRSTKIIRDYHNSHNKVYLKNIAHTLSNIGDTLFSVLDTSKSKDKKLDSVVVLNRISKKWDDGNKISNAVSEISSNDNDLIKKERLVKVLIDIVDYESWKEELIQLEAGLTVEENFKVKLESLIKEVKKIKNLNNGETNLKRIENLKKLCANGWYLWDKDFNNEQLVEIIAFLRFEEIYEKKNLKLIEKEKLLTERKSLLSANEDEKLSEDENNLVKEKEELNYDWNQNKEKIAKIAEYITPLKNGYRIMAFLDKYVAEYFEYEDFKK